MFVWDRCDEAARLAFKHGGRGGKEIDDKGGGAKEGAKEVGTFANVGDGTLEFRECQL